MAATATSKKKAAMLLMNLDSATAAEMLKELGAEEIEQIAVEMAQINASGPRDKKKQDEIVREFCVSLRKGQSQPDGIPQAAKGTNRAAGLYGEAEKRGEGGEVSVVQAGLTSSKTRSWFLVLGSRFG